MADGGAKGSSRHGGIAYCRDEIVRLEAVEKASAYQARSRVRPSSAVGLALYLSRGRGKDEVQQQSYDFSGRADELVLHEVLLPPGTPEPLRDPVTLWNAAQVADMTKPRKGRPPRPKKGAQVAVATVLALPRALELDDQVELVRRWCAAHYSDVGVQFDIHDPLVSALKRGIEATRDDFPNIHAHILRTTRRVGPNGLGRKQRPEDRPDGLRFSASGRVAHGSDWPKRWAAFQNEFFKEKGLDLRVAPVSLSPGLHLGKQAARRKDAWASRENAVREVEARAAVRDPEEWASYLRDWCPVFDESDIAAIASRHGVDPKKATAITHGLSKHVRVEPLYDPDTGEPVELWRVRAEDEPASEPQPGVPPARQAAAEEARRRNALVEEEAMLVRLRRRLAALVQRLRRVLQAAEREAEAAAARDGWSGGAVPSSQSALETVASSLFVHPEIDAAALARLEADFARWNAANRATCRRRTEQAVKTTRNPGFERGLDLLDRADAIAAARPMIVSGRAPVPADPPFRRRSRPDDDALAQELAAEMAARAERHQQSRRERQRQLRRQRQR